jgi:hypothetical protein
VLVIGEIRQGVERLRARNPRRAQALERWLEELMESFGERVLPVDEKRLRRTGAGSLRGEPFPWSMP